YFGDDHFCIRKDFSNLDHYIEEIIEICKKNEITAVITLIDPELTLLSEYSDTFLAEGILPIVSAKEAIEMTFDKYLFYQKLKGRLPVLKTWDGLIELQKALSEGRAEFPVLAKERCGSGSIGIRKISNEAELRLWEGVSGYIFQPFLEKKEYGADLYFDLKTGELSGCFIKEKLNMRYGETDKAISVHSRGIKELLVKLEGFGFLGPVDVDVFEDREGKYWINEINPRFGGGYPHAYHCGVDFIRPLLYNVEGKTGFPIKDDYPDGITMMKYNNYLFMEPGQDEG
ncbi:MAG: ATP-grasp domain-containing protein, partial [Lachnospiraceae bacterium]|nr:ATP-grasp domain-containing protein [Lachnospiraceae bacterium]